MTRFACPTTSTASIIEEKPRPAASTSKAARNVPQVSVCGIHTYLSHSDQSQRGRWACPGSAITEETPQPQPVASTSKAVPIKPVCIDFNCVVILLTSPQKRVNFNTDKGKGKALKPNQRATKKEQIIDARKKEQMRHKLALDRNPTNYVFVGNVSTLTYSRIAVPIIYRLVGFEDD